MFHAYTLLLAFDQVHLLALEEELGWDDDDDDRQPIASTSLVSEVPEPDALELLAGLSQFELRAANLEANAIYVRGGISLLY